MSDTADAASEPDFSTLSLPFAPGEWPDADERMFHACFAILSQYVESELGTEPWECMGGEDDMYRGYRLHSADVAAGEGVGGPEGGPSPDRAAIDLWLWYRDELPALEKAYADDLHEVYKKPGGMRRDELDETGHVRVTIIRNHEPKFEDDWPEKIKDAKLRELIELRQRLWT